jgi:hypothetical protein
MNAPSEPAALVTRFADARDARRYVSELRRAGFRPGEVSMLAPRRELIVKQARIGAVLGALAGFILGLGAGLYLTGSVPGVNPSIDIHPILGIALAGLIGTIVGIIPGVLVALLVPPEDSGESVPELAAIEQTLVVVETKDPARQDLAFEILARFKGRG